MNALREQDVVSCRVLFSSERLKRKAQALKNHLTDVQVFLYFLNYFSSERLERNYQDLQNQLTDVQSFLNHFSMESLERNVQALDLQDQNRLP